MWFWILLGLGGAFVAGAAIASRAEQQRLLAPPDLPEQPPMRLLTATATDVANDNDIAHPKTLCQVSITPGKEVFTSPLPQGMLKLTFQGCFAMKKKYGDREWIGVDACYETDKNFNYLKRHHSLQFNGVAVYDDPVEADRATHRYVFEFQSEGGRIGILMNSPVFYPDTNATSGVIYVSVAVCSPHESPALAKERKCEEERTKRALELAVLAHLESNFLDPDYQKDYAASHMPRILHHESKEWLAEYKEVIADPELYALIEAEHPHVLEFLEARLEVVRIAQRLAVKPPPKPKAPEGKRRLTREEWELRIERYRQRQLDRMRVQAEDHIAKQLQKFELAEVLRTRAHAMNLDEDDIERLVQELFGDLDDADEDTGKGFQQL